MKGDKQKTGNSMDKGAEAHVFALGDSAGSPCGWCVGFEGHVCLSFLYPMCYELHKGRLSRAGAFPGHIQQGL